MKSFAQKYLSDVGHMDGFILTNDSPSTGIGQVKHYQNRENGAPVVKMGSGVFAEQIIHHFPGYPIESYRRLQNKVISEIFFTKVFALAKLRVLPKRDAAEHLSRFHRENQLLFELYSPHACAAAEKLLGPGENPTLEAYRQHMLLKILLKGPDKASYMHIFQQMHEKVKCYLGADEAAYYLELIKHYEQGQIDKAPLFTLFKIWAM